MAGVEQGNVSNEKFMEEVARYQCVYHRNSKVFKDKNKKANCWEKIGEKFNLSAAEAEVKFRNIRTAYGRLKRLKTLPSGSGRDAVPKEFQNRLTTRRNKFACSKISSLTSAILFAAIFPPAQRACNFDSSAVRNVCNSRLCDRLRSSTIVWKQLSLRSSAICDLRSAIVCDHMETSLKHWF